MTGTDGRAVLDIDLSAVAANWRTLRGRHPSGPVAAVLKADGYGLGAVAIARRLLDEGCRHFFVALIDEALTLRNAVPQAMIGVLNPVPTDALRECAANRLWPALGSLEEVARWAGLDGTPPALLHVDTGLARTGLSAAELARVRDHPGLLAKVDWRFVMTHLVSAEQPDDPVNEAQLARFDDLDWLLPGTPRSLANSSGLFRDARFGSALARPGAALYGVNPTPALPNPMLAVATLSAPVLQIRDIGTGQTVGYNGTWTAARPSRIATLGVGYADGWPRSLTNRGRAAFDGSAVPLVGRVSMDLTTYDVTDVPAIGLGSRLQLIGPARPLSAIATEAGTNEYEILTSLGHRYLRRAR